MSKFVIGDQVISNYPIGSDNAKRFGTNRELSTKGEGRIGTIEGVFTSSDAVTSDQKVFIVKYNNLGNNSVDNLALATEKDLLHLPERRIADLEKAVERLQNPRLVSVSNFPQNITSNHA